MLGGNMEYLLLKRTQQDIGRNWKCENWVNYVSSYQKMKVRRCGAWGGGLQWPKKGWCYSCTAPWKLQISRLFHATKISEK